MEHKCNKSDAKAIEKCELNANEIMKALECCNKNNFSKCTECPCGKVYQFCSQELCLEALSLIKELTEENERLTNNIVEQSAENMMLIGENKRLQKALNTDISIVRVSRGSGKTAHLREVGRIKVDAIRADTVRKMQERLKEHLEKPEFPWDSFTVAEEVIDQIAKEMLEEGSDEKG